MCLSIITKPSYKMSYIWFIYHVATPLWGKCEDEIHTPKSGNLESSGTPATSELHSRGQNTLPWGVFYTVGKFLKSRCRKWLRMSHLDICNTSWSKEGSGVKLPIWLTTTKSWESTRPRCVQIECDTPLKSSRGKLQVFFRPRSNPRSEPGVMSSQSPGSPNWNSFATPLW